MVTEIKSWQYVAKFYPITSLIHAKFIKLKSIPIFLYLDVPAIICLSHWFRALLVASTPSPNLIRVLGFILGNIHILMYNMSGILVYSNVVLKHFTFFLMRTAFTFCINIFDQIKIYASLISFNEAVGHLS